MFAVLKKELRSYLYSVTGCLFVAINLLVLGLYFLANNLLGMSASTAGVMANVVFVLLIMVPILTMRILSEEKHLKTDQLLFTSPVSVFKIILGKYLSLLVIFMLPVIVSCVFPLIVNNYGEASMGESYVSILAYFLFGAACLSVGLFISSLTESQVIAAVLTFIALFLTYLMSGIISILTSGGNKVAEILTVFDFNSRLNNMMKGILDIKDVVYYLSVIVVMLFFTVQSVLKRRYTVSRKTLSLTVFSNSLIVVVVAAAVIGNFFLNKLPSAMTEYDVTRDALYTLTDESRAFLNDLTDDITIYVAGTKELLENYDYKEVVQTLDQYAALSPHIKVVYKDPSTDPDFLSTLTDEELSVGSVVVTAGDRKKTVQIRDLYESTMDYQTYSQIKTGYDGEGQITSAILYVTTDDLPKLYVITGHSELTIDTFTRLNKAVSKLNIETEELNLMNVEEVPEDASAVMILDPQTDYTDDDVKKLESYLSSGGDAIVSLGYNEEGTPKLDKVFAEYGVTHENVLVIEGDEQYMYQSPLYLLPEVDSSVITEKIKGSKLLCLVPQASAFKVDETKLEAGEIEQALVTSKRSFAKKELNKDTTGQKEAGDETGPFTVAAYINTGEDTNRTKIALFSAVSLFDDVVDQTVGGANVTLVSSALSDMVDFKIDSAIPAKSFTQSNITIPYGTALLIGLVFIIIIPLFVLIAGILLWYRRRRR
ncbi:MAG: Gldg family protein [Lachnospiraceae bacterium]|nr:Gldg family protein [Lachnospiraceae bacterium]